MASPLRQIFAFSGVLDSGAGEKESFALAEYALGLAAQDGGPTQACYVPTAAGDAQAAIDFYEGKFARRPGARLSVLRLFPQPSVPDVAAHLLSQDLILVEGGSVVNLMAVWRAHGLRRSCADAGPPGWSWPGPALAACAGIRAAPPALSMIVSTRSPKAWAGPLQ